MPQLFNRQGVPRHAHKGFAVPTYETTRPCSRCGGQGGADKWGKNGTNTGWTCWRCGGSGVDPSPLREKLYTAEQNAKLDAAQKKRDENRARKQAAAAEAERLRQEAQREEIISINLDLLERIEAELAHGEIEILVSVRDYIRAKAKMPSERQVEVVEKIIAANAAERKRLEMVSHLGEIGVRRDFTLTLLYTRSTKDDVYWSHWSLFLDETGSKVACTSDPYILGLRVTKTEDGDFVYSKGQTIRVKATVKKHDRDKKSGEPITYIQRPKALESVA